MGELTVRRGYYYCHRCGGTFPWDQDVGLTTKRLTPGAERAASLAGLLTDSFEEAAEKVLPELSGLHLSETTVQRTTEAAGERLGKHLDEGKVLGGPTPWRWHQDAEGQSCAYVSVDATGVRQQACGGGAAYRVRVATGLHLRQWYGGAGGHRLDVGGYVAGDTLRLCRLRQGAGDSS